MIVLLNSGGFKTESVNVEGLRVDETCTEYELIEILQGRSSRAWGRVRGSNTIPYPGDYERRMPNMGVREAGAGQRVLAFSNLNFDSCRFVLATPSVEAIVRNTAPAPRPLEDEMALGLM